VKRRCQRSQWCRRQIKGSLRRCYFRPCKFVTCKKVVSALRCSGQIQLFGRKSLPHGRSSCTQGALCPLAGKGLVLSFLCLPILFSVKWFRYVSLGKTAGQLRQHSSMALLENLPLKHPKQNPLLQKQAVSESMFPWTLMT
jgi:hypothetical protein